VGGQLGGGHRWLDVGQLRQVGEPVGVVSMQPRPFAGQQVGVDNLPQQRVPDLVALLTRPGHQQLVRDHNPERLGQILVVQAGDARQEPVGHLSASHRKHLLGALGQRLDPAAQQVPQRDWQLSCTGLVRR
jgi:hypothetical protein